MGATDGLDGRKAKGPPMYLLVSSTRQHGTVVKPGLSLVQAYRLLGRLGRGAIFRETGLTKYSRPVYPRGY